MAHKKGGGTATINRDSAGKRLGIKASGGQTVSPGNIIVRQRGTKFYAGKGSMIGKDHTIFAVVAGAVKFRQKQGKKFIDVL